MKPAAALLALLVCACATGSSVMLRGALPEHPGRTKEQIELFVQPPQRSYRVIALVSASASFAGFGGVAGAEEAALDELKRQAARAGADAVIEIRREIYLGGVLISSTRLNRSPVAVVESSGSASTSPGVHFLGKAIKFE
jgi:hypothetical protein